MTIRLSSQFDSKFRKLLRRQPSLEISMQTALTLLMEDLKAPSLKAHKLSGKLKNQWAFWLTYKLRVVFKRKGDTIILINIGTHDEVY